MTAKRTLFVAGSLPLDWAEAIVVMKLREAESSSVGKIEIQLANGPLNGEELSPECSAL